MQIPEYCPACGYQLPKSRNKCRCGWVINVVNLDEKPRKDICGVMTDEGPCLKDGTRSIGRSSQWICGDHWREISFGKAFK
jgi:hypothetical protein